MVGGDGQFRVEDELYPVRADQLVIVDPDVLHREVSFEALLQAVQRRAFAGT